MLTGLILLLAACTGGTPKPVPHGPVVHGLEDAVGLADPPEDMRCKAPRFRADCLIQIPAGSFRMGAQATDTNAANYDAAARADEGPVHTVSVPSFWIARAEASAGLFHLCVHDGVCKADDVRAGAFASWQPGVDASRSDTPINGISWEGARRLCGFYGGRLPTEAEWEYAARGSEARRWPWGNDAACGTMTDDSARRFGRIDGPIDMRKPPCATDGPRAAKVLMGESPFGVVGMAGNVLEWTADLYQPTYGAPPSTARVQRGGGWTSDDPLDLRAAARTPADPSLQLPDVGVRCVWGLDATLP